MQVEVEFFNREEKTGERDAAQQSVLSWFEMWRRALARHVPT
jgi:hypothetical protein